MTLILYDHVKALAYDGFVERFLELLLTVVCKFMLTVRTKGQIFVHWVCLNLGFNLPSSC